MLLSDEIMIKENSWRVRQPKGSYMQNEFFQICQMLMSHKLLLFLNLSCSCGLFYLFIDPAVISSSS